MRTTSSECPTGIALLLSPSAKKAKTSMCVSVSCRYVNEFKKSEERPSKSTNWMALVDRFSEVEPK